LTKITKNHLLLLQSSRNFFLAQNAAKRICGWGCGRGSAPDANGAATYDPPDSTTNNNTRLTALCPGLRELLAER